MAIQVNLTDTDVGLPAPKAYARVTGISCDFTNGQVHVSVNIFANSAAAKDAEKNPVGGGLYKFKVSDHETRDLIYKLLKTLPEFADAIDC
jgi:hypothetical protein